VKTAAVSGTELKNAETSAGARKGKTPPPFQPG